MHDEAFSPYVPRKLVPPKPIEPAPAPVESSVPAEQVEMLSVALRAEPKPQGDVEPLDVAPERSAAFQFDGQLRREALREEALGLATAACARALGEAARSNADVIAKFVDDAIAATGHAVTERVRLHPDDAAVLDPSRCSPFPDGALRRGEAIVETSHGNVRATLDERAALLVRAASADVG